MFGTQEGESFDLFEQGPGEGGEEPRFQAFTESEGQIEIDLDSLTPEITSRMNRTLKAKGYNVRGANDVKELIAARNGIIRMPDWIDAYKQAIGSVKKRKATLAKKADFKNINWQRLRELGKTYNLKEAGYIVPDGSLVDLSGKREGGQPGNR
jgi:hypothetical protein